MHGVQVRKWKKHMPDHADRMAPTRCHELDRTDLTYVEIRHVLR